MLGRLRIVIGKRIEEFKQKTPQKNHQEFDSIERDLANRGFKGVRQVTKTYRESRRAVARLPSKTELTIQHQD
jgi:hypothetical protein